MRCPLCGQEITKLGRNTTSYADINEFIVPENPKEGYDRLDEDYSFREVEKTEFFCPHCHFVLDKAEIGDKLYEESLLKAGYRDAHGVLRRYEFAGEDTRSRITDEIASAIRSYKNGDRFNDEEDLDPWNLRDITF